ncbi:MAG: nitrous oxide reductase family maturation protein NosD [Flavobacteriaceae bacterium]|nr:nitrous oxide reductase family maturation protein NosD [Bacteroidia bacterium]MBT8288420.1 nitrous oxide reductase family maturation protein NosD [Bacteroidia bacterium]NNF73740.1 nitrous oxide reductase family maturation protein NosD [Flavobacteriaceae bacterium]NNK73309.1 nitrous oxide reductase family maturation protein NosD [Flavobacteriaceae bacterium]
MGIRNFILAFSVLFWFYQNAYSQPIEVCSSCEIKTIKAGISMVKHGDTLLIKNGTYSEYDLIVDKPMVILGESNTIIDGQKKGEIITIESDSVVIDGLHIRNVGISYTEDFAALRVRKSKNFEIRNLILDELFFGIYIEKSSHGKILNNLVSGNAKDEHNSGNGIHLWYSHHLQIDNNKIRGLRDGIYLEFADDCTISNNISKDNLRYGLHFMFSNRDTYSNNVFENNGSGVAVMFSKHIEMIENRFQKNWGSASYGLLLKEINDAEIIKNDFLENTIAINVEGSNRITYKNNNFRNNGWAVKVRGACYSNIFTENNFLYNSFDISYNSKVNDNQFNRNYWSNYSGYDLDNDGVGDVPFRPVKLFSYVVNRTPETIVLMRSLFVDIIDFSEKVSPVFTPDNLVDQNPVIKEIKW